MPQNFSREIAPGTLAQILGHERLIKHLGYWPTFDDFEVASVALSRAVVAAAACTLRVTFLVFDSKKKPDAPDRKQGSAELLFEDVDALHIDGFNHQNPILGLSIVQIEPIAEKVRFQVAWGGSAIKHDVSLICSAISVVQVVDLNPFQKPSLIF